MLQLVSLTALFLGGVFAVILDLSAEFRAGGAEEICFLSRTISKESIGE